MNGATEIGLAALILLLLPAMVAELDAKRLADPFYAGIGAGGLVFAFATGGMTAVAHALLAGLMCLLLLSGVIAGVTALWHRRLLTGAHIKLLSAGAIWLGMAATATMLLLTAIITILLILLTYFTSGNFRKPAITVVMSLCLIATFIGIEFIH